MPRLRGRQMSMTGFFYQFVPTRLLFIYSQNKWRSLTAERLFDNHTTYEASSAGTEPGARVRVTAGYLG